MRVTLITETYAPQVNGVSRTLGQLVRVLRASGDRVQVIHPDYGKPTDGEDDRLVRSIRLPFYREVSLPVPPFGGVARAVEEFGPDLVHIATEATLGLAMLRTLGALGLPIVSSFHTNFDQYTDHYGVGFARGCIWRYLRWFHNRTRETYVPSRATIRDLERRGFERLVLWPRGVDGTLFRPDRPGRLATRRTLGIGPEEVVIGHVSRIALEKNVEYLAEALEIVARSRPGTRIVVVGDGPARPALEERLAGIAAFVGYRTGEDLADHYTAFDLFAFASRTETFGNVVLEALATGLPVVAIRSGGPGEIVRDGETGLLVEPDRPAESFAGAILRLIDDAGLRRGMAARARSYAETQTWDAIMGGLRDRYVALIQDASTILA